MRYLIALCAVLTLNGCYISKRQYLADMDAARVLGYIEGRAGVTEEQLATWIKNVQCEEIGWDESEPGMADDDCFDVHTHKKVPCVNVGDTK